MAAVSDSAEARAHHEALARFVLNNRDYAAAAVEAALANFNVGKPGWDKFSAMILSRSDEGVSRLIRDHRSSSSRCREGESLTRFAAWQTDLATFGGLSSDAA